MIETIAAVIGGGLAVTAFFISKKKQNTDNVFTIKSDKVSIEDTPGQGYQPTPRERPESPPRPQSPSEAPTSYPSIESAVTKSMKPLDMSKVTGIRFQGTGDVHLNNGKLFVDDKASVYVKRETLWIESKGNIIKVSGNLFGSNQGYSNTSMVEVPLTNLDVSNFDRVSLNGSGDMKLSNMRIDNSLDVIIQGSGDIVITNISTGTLELTVKGSGDITVDKKCRATQTLASVKGSGDITVKSNTVGVVAKKIKGSGDINLPKSTNTVKQKKKKKYSSNDFDSYFDEPLQKDGKWSDKFFSETSSSHSTYTTITTTYE